MRGAGGWRCNFPRLVMMHLPQPPPNVPPVWSAAPVVAVAKAVPKAVPKPAPKKGVDVPYGGYSNIRAAVVHFGGCLATGQHGAGGERVPLVQGGGGGPMSVAGGPPPEA